MRTSDSILNKYFQRLVLLASLAALLTSRVVLAAFEESDLAQSMVSVNIYSGKDLQERGSGLVVQSDRFNGYVVTNASILHDEDTVTISVPRTGAELVATVLRKEPQYDFALLKVNGLNAPALSFSPVEPAVGDIVWSAVKRQGDNTSVGLSRGTLRNQYETPGLGVSIMRHSAVIGEGGIGSILLNDCGHVVGLNMAALATDGGARAVAINSLRGVLNAENVRVTYADTTCISEIAVARSEAEAAAEEARRAQQEAEKAQAVARDLERRLAESNEKSEAMVLRTREARARADSAMAAAEAARQELADTRQEFQAKSEEIQATADSLVADFELNQEIAHRRFEQALARQQEQANTREYVLMVIVAVLFVGVVLALIIRRRIPTAEPALMESANEPSIAPPNTEMHDENFREFVLDGRDDAGIRYLLRISGDQLLKEEGAVIGRNPKDSPFIINHADVSRKHARMRITRNRAFIEDLGSTNGTSVNGQSIDDKGLVSVDNGDQIIIGSVVMNLKVM